MVFPENEKFLNEKIFVLMNIIDDFSPDGFLKSVYERIYMEHQTIKSIQTSLRII